MKHIRILDGGLLVIHSTNVNIHVSLLQVFNIMPPYGYAPERTTWDRLKPDRFDGTWSQAD